MTDIGPFRNEREASAAARAVIPPEPDWSILSQAQRAEVLHRALAEAGVETSEFEDSIAWWLSDWGDHYIGIIARWITAEREPAGVEWGIRFKPGGWPAEHPAGSEGDARKVLAAMRESNPEWGAALIVRSPERPAGPWRLADEPSTGKAGEGNG
jgi:hypothetical protein